MADLSRDLALMSDGLATVSEAAAFLGLSRSKLYDLMDQGFLAYVKLDRARRIPRRALVELAAANVVGGWLARSRGERDDA
jgi:excisionase family DNA binding protein